MAKKNAHRVNHTESPMALALRVLCASEAEGAHVYRQLKRAQDVAQDEVARARVEQLVLGVLRRRITIDYILDCYASTKAADMKPVIRNILRLGTFRLIFAEGVPEASVVDSAVKLTRVRGFHQLTGFVNAVLRKIAKEKDSIDFPDDSIRYSVPSWIADLLRNRYGEAESAAMLSYFLTAPSPVIRLAERLNRQETETLFAMIKRERAGAEITAHPLFPYAYRLTHAGSIRTLPGFREGLFFVQDAGAMLAAELCGDVRGKTVIDVCAAPGGKALHLAERGAEVFAFDVNPRKCHLIRENAQRLFLNGVRIDQVDARVGRSDLRGCADLVLCDVPCSGLGVLKRKSDIKYRLQPGDLTALQQLQREILRTSVTYLKDGGRLLYATCTLTEEENEDNVCFIRESLGLKPMPLQAFLPKALQHLRGADEGFLTLLPGVFDTDGFFYAGFTA